MRALLQRARRAEVRVEDEVVGVIGHGLVILLGIGVDDEEKDAVWLAKKCTELRIFDDHEGRLNRSLQDVDGEALVVSQFTLYGDPRKGRRPSYVQAAQPEKAMPLLEVFCRKLEEAGVEVAQGRFGAHMEVDLVNDGPVTLMVESPGR
jgi:D-tyrosyl-tRNA(Tyr) deacylase